MKIAENKKVLLLTVYVLFLTGFFGAIYLPHYFFLGTFAPLAFWHFLTKKMLFKWNIALVFCGVVLSVISCYYYRNQSVALTLKSGSNIYYLAFYFVISRVRLKDWQFENFISLMCAIFCCCYIFQYLVYPKVIFSGALMQFPDGNVRLRLSAMGLASLGYFFHFNKVLLEKNKVKHIVMMLLAFFVIFLTGFRSALVSCGLFTMYLYFVVEGFNMKIFKYMILVVVLAIVFLNIPSVGEKLEFLKNRNESQGFGNYNYIRFQQLDYYYNYHFKSFWELLFGSGLTYEGSDYEYYMRKLQEDGIFWADWGLLGLSWVLGVFTVLAMIVYGIRAGFTKLTKDKKYANIWFLYMILVSMLTAEYFRTGNFLVQAIVLGFIDQHLQKYKAHAALLERERLLKV